MKQKWASPERKQQSPPFTETVWHNNGHQHVCIWIDVGAPSLLLGTEIYTEKQF